MKKIVTWVGALGAIGTIIFMLKNHFEDRKEIKRLDEESTFWKDAYKKELDKSCALEVEKSGIRYLLRRMGEDLYMAMLKSNLTYWEKETLDDYLSDD